MTRISLSLPVARSLASEIDVSIAPTVGSNPSLFAGAALAEALARPEAETPRGHAAAHRLPKPS
jgi:hypothetical protein